MIRLLCIVGKMSADGAETFLMKIYRNLDKSAFQMDFCVTTFERGFYDDEIESLGGRIFRIPPKTKGFFKNFNAIKKIVKINQYKHVLRVSQHSLSAMELYAAKKGGASVLAFRSSNSNTCGGRFNSFLHRFFMFLPRKVANVRIAPSTESATFMFGLDYVKKGKCIILPNALNINDYLYSKASREKIRKEFGLEEKFVIGNVGRFTNQKNHCFLLKVFESVLQRNNDARLMLVGEGELESTIRQEAANLGIIDKIVFAGVRKDIGAFLSSMDVFVFPSLFEGMPNALIEAQANGLQSFVSNTITREANICGSVEYLPLNETEDYWASSILNSKKGRKTDVEKMFAEKGYSISSAVNCFVSSIFLKNGEKYE